MLSSLELTPDGLERRRIPELGLRYSPSYTSLMTNIILDRPWVG